MARGASDMEENSTVGSTLKCPKCDCPVGTFYMPCPSCGHYESTPP